MFIFLIAYSLLALIFDQRSKFCLLFGDIRNFIMIILLNREKTFVLDNKFFYNLIIYMIIFHDMKVHFKQYFYSQYLLR